MLTLAEQQKGIIHALSSGRLKALEGDGLGLCQGAPSLRRLSDAIRRARRNRIRLVMPRTINAIWMEFGILFDAFAGSIPSRSIDPVSDADAFLSFVGKRLESVFAAPPYLSDLGRLEIDIFRVGRADTLLPDARNGRCISSGLRAIPVVWVGNHDLRPLFEAAARDGRIDESASACLIWREPANDAVRVVGIDPQIAPLIDTSLCGEVVDDETIGEINDLFSSLHLFEARR